MVTCPRRVAALVGLVLAAVLALAGCRVAGGTTQVTDDKGACTQVTVPSFDAAPPSAATTLPGVVLAPCPTTTPPASSSPATTTPPASTSTTPSATPSATTTPSSPASTPPATTTTVPPTSSSTPPPPAGDGVTAAARLGWGTPIAAASDEFNDTVIDRAKWGLPGECWPANSTVKAGRCGSHNREANGYVRQTMTPDGKTGYMSNRFGQKYGKWEVRGKITTATPGKPGHPNWLLWPDSERWPQGGEYDYMEVSSDAQRASAYIHHPTQSGVKQDIYHSGALNLGEWHNYAIEWTPQRVRGFIDGVAWFDDTNPGAQAPGPMHGTIQLDNFVGTSGMATVHMDTDWFRVYAP